MNEIGSNMEQLSQYYVEKPKDDYDLITLVRTMLINSGLSVNAINYYDTHPLIIGSIGKISTVQRFNLNRFWSLQLMSTNSHSEEERYCLIPNGSIQDWLKLFESKVLPFIIQNSLPKAI